MSKIKKILICSTLVIILLTILRVYPQFVPVNIHKWLSLIICVLVIVCLVTLLKMGRNLVAVCIGIVTFCVYGIDSLQIFGIQIPTIFQYIEKIIQMGE